MNRWRFTITFVLLGAFLSWVGYILVQQMFFPAAILLLPTILTIKLLGWDSVFEFYHSGNPVDHFGMAKVVLIATIEFGFVGWCIDLIRHRKAKSSK